MYGIGLRLNDNTTFSQTLPESLPLGTSAKRPKWPTQSQLIQNSSEVIVQAQSYQSILPAIFSTSIDFSPIQISQLLTSYSPRSINYTKKKKQLLKVFTAWAQPKIPPHSLNSVLIKTITRFPKDLHLDRR